MKIFIINILQYITSLHFNQRWKLFYNRYIFSIYKNLIYRNAIGYTIFLVNTSGVYTNKFDGFPTLEHAKYNWPWEKHGFSKSKPQIVIVWAYDLLIVIANAKWIGNCKRLNNIGESEGFIGIRGRSTTSPWNFLLKTVASRMLPMILFMTSRMPSPNTEWCVIKFIKD